MNALRREIEGMLRNAPPDLRFSFCEVFTGVPKHLDRNGTGVLAWSCTIEGLACAYGSTLARACVVAPAPGETLPAGSVWLDLTVTNTSGSLV